jgi:hypothetical protein
MPHPRLAIIDGEEYYVIPEEHYEVTQADRDLLDHFYASMAIEAWPVVEKMEKEYHRRVNYRDKRGWVPFEDVPEFVLLSKSDYENTVFLDQQADAIDEEA